MSSIIRVEKDADNPYTMLNHAFLGRPDMSARAKCVLALLLSKPNDWTVTVNGLLPEMQEGRDFMRAALRELESLGYLVRRRIKAGGRFDRIESTVYETPRNGSDPHFQRNSPETALPASVEPATVKPPVLKTEDTKEREKASAVHPEAESIYAAYPRKESRKVALQKITSALKKGIRPADLLTAVQAYAKAVEGKEQQYILLCQTFMNQERWDDYLNPSPGSPVFPRPAQPGLKHAQTGKGIKLGKW